MKTTSAVICLYRYSVLVLTFALSAQTALAKNLSVDGATEAEKREACAYVKAPQDKVIDDMNADLEKLRESKKAMIQSIAYSVSKSNDAIRKLWKDLQSNSDFTRMMAELSKNDLDLAHALDGVSDKEARKKIRIQFGSARSENPLLAKLDEIVNNPGCTIDFEVSKTSESSEFIAESDPEMSCSTTTLVNTEDNMNMFYTFYYTGSDTMDYSIPSASDESATSDKVVEYLTTQPPYRDFFQDASKKLSLKVIEIEGKVEEFKKETPNFCQAFYSTASGSAISKP